MAVYEYLLKEKIQYIKIDEKYELPFSDETKDLIVEMWSAYRNGKFFNSENVRLDAVRTEGDKSVLVISRTDFYSLLLTNIIRLDISGFRVFAEEHCKNDKYLKSLQELLEYYSSLKECNGFEDLILNGNLANALAISVQVVDTYGNAMLVKRSGNVGIGKNLYSVTSTGAVDLIDWNTDDPIRSCAVRELEEELNLRLDCSDLEITGIVAGVVKKQPIAILNAYVDHDLREINGESARADDYKFEVDKVHICRIDDIESILDSQEFTEAAEYHLKKIINDSKLG